MAMPASSKRRRLPPRHATGSVSRAGKAKEKRGWFLDYERRHHPLLPWPAFLRRVLVNLGLGLAVVGGSLAIGIWGYHFFEGLAVLDSFLNASMILSGMGPLWSPRTEGGKLFAGLYALYSGLAVLAIAGLVFAPLIHRFMHRFHAIDDDSVADAPMPEKKP
jgi:hypothetical protein